MKKNYANFPFPSKGQYTVPPLLPVNIDTNKKIIELFKQILLNDLIIDTNAPVEKDKFRMVLRHCQSWDIDEGSIEVSHITTSESHGYGMMILAYMAGCEDALNLQSGQWLCGCESLHDYYDAMLRTVIEFPSVVGKNNKLFAWELFGFPGDEKNRTGYKEINDIKSAPFTRDNESGDCATDGDMDIIFSLFLADKQWGTSGNYNYKKIALTMLDCLWEYCIHKKHHTLLLGDWASEKKGTSSEAGRGELNSAIRISDIIPSHIKTYIKEDKNHNWQEVLDAIYKVIGDLCESKKHQNGLLPDFAVFKNGKWAAPEKTILEGDDNAYSYNACRVPWRLGSDYLLHGDTKIGKSSLFNLIIKPLDEFAANFTKGDFDLLGPLNLDGTLIQDSDPETFTSPFIVTASANKENRNCQNWINQFWNWETLCAYNGDNYGDYVKLLSMLTASGYAWY